MAKIKKEFKCFHHIFCVGPAIGFRSSRVGASHTQHSNLWLWLIRINSVSENVLPRRKPIGGHLDRHAGCRRKPCKIGISLPRGNQVISWNPMDLHERFYCNTTGPGSKFSPTVDPPSPRARLDGRQIREVLCKDFTALLLDREANSPGPSHHRWSSTPRVRLDGRQIRGALAEAPDNLVSLERKLLYVCFKNPIETKQIDRCANRVWLQKRLSYRCH